MVCRELRELRLRAGVVFPEACPTTEAKVLLLVVFDAEIVEDPATIAEERAGAKDGTPALLLLLLPGVLLGEQPSFEF